MANFRIEIEHDNFNNYFARHVEQMTETQKDLLPRELNYRIFKKGGLFRASSSVRLNFLTKLFILIKCFKKRWVLLIEDENGIGPEQFFKVKEEYESEGYTVGSAEDCMNNGVFCLGNRELIDGFAALNKISVSPAYNYVSRLKNVPASRTGEWKDKAKYIVSFLSKYDGIKKDIIMRSGISLPELYTLFYLYDGEEKVASSVYKERYRYTYSASKGQIQQSFVSLQNRGMVRKIGLKKGAKLVITPVGVAAINDILTKYIINI